MKNRNILLILALSALLPMAVSCVRPEPEPEPQPDLASAWERLSDSEKISFFAEMIKNDPFYVTTGCHCPSMVETSTDSYDFENDSSAYVYSEKLGVKVVLMPHERLDTMSTLGIIETILENKYNYNNGYYYGDPLSRGISMERYVDTTSVNELLRRDDAASVLIGKYLGMYYCYENNYSAYGGKGIHLECCGSNLNAAFFGISRLLGQHGILEKATDDEIDALSMHLIEAFVSGYDYYGGEFYIESAGCHIWLAAWIMESCGYRPMLAYVSEKPKSMTYVHEYGGLFMDSFYKRIPLMFKSFIESRHE